MTLCHSEAERVTAACNDMAYEAIIEACELAASYARSTVEAAWRGDRRLCEGHLVQLRACVVTALAARKRLCTPPEDSAHG